MKKKSIIAITCVVLLIAIVAYGINTKTRISTTADNIDTNTNEINTEPSTENEVAIETEEPTEEPTEEIAENNTEESTEVVADEDGIPDTGNFGGLTADEAAAADTIYFESLGHNIDTWIDFAKSQGADDAEGCWWIYYYDGVSGNQNRSYAINQRTGEKIVAGPYAYFYYDSADSASNHFFGSDKIFPGDSKEEFLENMELFILRRPAHTNGQGDDEDYDYLNKE